MLICDIQIGYTAQILKRGGLLQLVLSPVWERHIASKGKTERWEKQEHRPPSSYIYIYTIKEGLKAAAFEDIGVLS